jgi:Flp pilus assembly protein TadD
MGILLSVVVALGVSVPLQQANPDSVRLARWHYDKGVDQMRVEQWDQAADEFRAAIESDPLMSMAHYNLGQCRMAQKRYVEAVTAYKGARSALEGQSNLSEKDRGLRERERLDEINELKESLQRLSSLEVKQGPMNQQRTGIEERIRILENMRFNKSNVIPVPAEFSLALGSAYFRQEKLEDAEREYRQAVEVNPKLGAAQNNLAVIYMLSGRLDEAEAAVKAAEKSGFPVNPRLKDDIKKARAK